MSASILVGSWPCRSSHLSSTDSSHQGRLWKRGKDSVDAELGRKESKKRGNGISSTISSLGCFRSSRSLLCFLALPLPTFTPRWRYAECNATSSLLLTVYRLQFTETEKKLRKELIAFQAMSSLGSLPINCVNLGSCPGSNTKRLPGNWNYLTDLLSVCLCEVSIFFNLWSVETE